MAPVTLYTRKGCGYSARARQLLSQKGVDFDDHDAGSDPKLREEMERRSNGGSTFPQVFIGDRHVGGAEQLEALEQNGELDGLLGRGSEGASPA